MTTEKRRHQRYDVEVACEVEVGGEVVVAATKNLSEGGAMIEVAAPLRDGMEVEVVLFLTEDGIEDPDEEPLELKASVQWAGESDNPGYTTAGVQFSGLDAAKQAQLARFLEAIG